MAGSTIGRVVSVNVGRPRSVRWHGRTVTSAIWKHPVEGRHRVDGVNIEGDDQADRRVHGGPTKAVYAYAYPEPAGFRNWPVEPDGASYDTGLGEFLLPYQQVRTAEDPDATLLSFLQSTYEAEAELAHWDRDYLEPRLPMSGTPAV